MNKGNVVKEECELGHYNQDALISYLLGKLPDEEQRRFEEAFFADPDLLQNIRAAERDLIDGYVRGQLSGEDRARFESRFLGSAVRRERVLFATALSRTSSEAQVAFSTLKNDEVGLAQAPWWARLNPIRASLAAVIICFLAVGGFWLWSRVQERTNQFSNIIASSPASTPQADSTPPPQQAQVPEPRTPPAARVATFTLAPSGTRSSRSVRIKIPSTEITIRLQLRLPQNAAYQSYIVRLQTLEEETIWQRDSVKANVSRSERRLSVEIPAHIFRGSDYLLRVETVNGEYVSHYYFETVRK